LGPTQLGSLFSLLILTATAPKAESAKNRAALTAYLDQTLLAEDGFEDRYAVSRVGAQGLMQVMPIWRHEIGRIDDNLTHTPSIFVTAVAFFAFIWIEKTRT